MRTHQGIDPAQAWQLDEDTSTLTAFRRCVLLYRAWAVYRRQLSLAAARTGHPMMRPLVLHYVDDPVAATRQFSYLLGDTMLLDPVTTAGASQSLTYLPAGQWVHVWSERIWTSDSGQWVTVDAELGYPPVFLRTDKPTFRQLWDNFRRLA